MSDTGINLFQNSDFLDFASAAINPYYGEQEYNARVDIPIEVQQGSSSIDLLYDIFGLSDNEVCPYTTVEELFGFLKALYDYRVFIGLEQEPSNMLYEITEQPCSQGTEEAIEPFAILTEEGRETKGYDDVMSGFYYMVGDYLICGTSPCEEINLDDFDDSIFDIL